MLRTCPSGSWSTSFITRCCTSSIRRDSSRADVTITRARFVSTSVAFRITSRRRSGSTGSRGFAECHEHAPPEIRGTISVAKSEYNRGRWAPQEKAVVLDTDSEGPPLFYLNVSVHYALCSNTLFLDGEFSY